MSTEKTQFTDFCVNLENVPIDLLWGTFFTHFPNRRTLSKWYSLIKYFSRLIFLSFGENLILIWYQRSQNTFTQNYTSKVFLFVEHFPRQPIQVFPRTGMGTAALCTPWWVSCCSWWCPVWSSALSTPCELCMHTLAPFLCTMYTITHTSPNCRVCRSLAKKNHQALSTHR